MGFVPYSHTKWFDIKTITLKNACKIKNASEHTIKKWLSQGDIDYTEIKTGSSSKRDKLLVIDNEKFKRKQNGRINSKLLWRSIRKLLRNDG